MELAELACPLCDGVFQVEVAWQGTQVACPHCEQAVTVPALATAPPEEPPQIDVEPAAPQTAPPADDVRTAPPDVPPDVPTATPPKTSRLEELKLARRLPDAAAGASPFAVRDTTPKVVTADGRQIELRRRTPDEQARFRARLHIAVAVFGAVLLAALMFVLLRIQ